MVLKLTFAPDPDPLVASIELSSEQADEDLRDHWLMQASRHGKYLVYSLVWVCTGADWKGNWKRKGQCSKVR